MELRLNDGLVNLTNEELENIDGGVIPWIAIGAGIVAVGAAAATANALIDLGKNIGQGIYYATH